MNAMIHRQQYAQEEHSIGKNPGFDL